MQPTQIAYQNTGRFSQLVLDYINQDIECCRFFNNLPTLKGFENQIREKANFPIENRGLLVDRLLVQYEHLNLNREEKLEVSSRVEQLKKSNTFTVTTGHQLCLFTGPLYTVYKIIHIIRLAKELSSKFPEHNFVPVFWMASEDHDFEEVNHIRYKGHKLLWHAKAGDAVGRIKTEEIARTIDEFSKRLPAGERSVRVLNDLKSAYLEHQNLAEATRALVHKWFGKYGLVIIDGDDARLKETMIPSFKKELDQELSFTEVEKTNQSLSEKYTIQVTPREINLFYLNNGVRNRIVKQGEKYHVVNQEQNWSKEQIFAELDSYPERFSPNVILRPLYQETILPNVAYIGGGGEVAYWAQLQSMFNAFQVPFPIVALRQSVQISPKRIERKRTKLSLSYEELFKDYHVLSNELIKRDCDFEEQLAPFRDKLEVLYNNLVQLTHDVDPTLDANVEAQKTKALRRLMTLEKKLFRSAKRNESDMLRMLQECQNVLMPGGSLQERHDNIVQYLVEYGFELFEEILRAIEPFDQKFISLNE